MTTRFCPVCLTSFEVDRAACPSLGCGAARPARGWEALYEPGDLLDRHYRVQGVLALAGSGVTYRARAVDTSGAPSGPEVAVKVLYAHRDTSEHVRRLADEAGILRELAHPGIVECRAFVHRVGEPPYLVTTFEQGGTLAEHVARVGPLAPAVAGRVLAQMLVALDQAHRRGIVHRDLKPQNILLREPCGPDDVPRVRVADFGIARITTRTAGPTRVGMFVGTPAFAAPEQLLGHPATAATDVFAAGAVLWWMCTGRTLAATPDPADIEAAYDGLLAALPPRLDGHGPGLDALRAVLDGCLAVDPARRARIGAVLAALDDLAAAPARLAPADVVDPGGVTLAPSAGGITFVVPGPIVTPRPPAPQVVASPARADLSLDDLVSRAPRRPVSGAAVAEIPPARDAFEAPPPRFEPRPEPRPLPTPQPSVSRPAVTPRVPDALAARPTPRELPVDPGAALDELAWIDAPDAAEWVARLDARAVTQLSLAHRPGHAAARGVALARYAVVARRTDWGSRLRPLLGDPSGPVRGAAALALAQIGPVPATSALPAACNDADPSVRVVMIEALARAARGANRPDLARPTLRSALRDPVVAVRDAARLWLEQLD